VEAGIDADKGLGTGIVPDPAQRFLRLAAVTISVIPVLNAGGFVQLHFLMISTRTRSAVEALSWGLNRMPVKAAAVLLAAARTHLPTGRRRLLQSR
jgi:hypothetical protein